MNAPISHARAVQLIGDALHRYSIATALQALHRSGAGIQIWRCGSIWHCRIWPHGRPADRLDYSGAVHAAKREQRDAIAHALQQVGGVR